MPYHTCLHYCVVSQATARKDPEQNRDLQKLKLMFPHLWKLKVRSSRICPLNEIGTMPGVIDLASRRLAQASFLQDLKQYVKIEDRTPVLWLTYDRFMSHMKYVEGKTVEWAIAKWKEIKDNADIPKAGEGDDLEVPWRGIRSTEGVRGREISRAIQNSAALDNEEAAQGAIRRVATLGAQASLSQAEFGVLVRCFAQVRRAVPATLTPRCATSA